MNMVQQILKINTGNIFIELGDQYERIIGMDFFLIYYLFSCLFFSTFLVFLYRITFKMIFHDRQLVAN
jgi:hypothetical protein